MFKCKKDLEHYFEVIVFEIENRVFAVPVYQVCGCAEPESIRTVDCKNEMSKGIITLKNLELPVFDIRSKFKLSSNKEYSEKNSKIITVRFKNTAVGILIDKPFEFKKINSGEINDFPKHLKQEEIWASCKTRDSLILLLDLEKLFTSDELDYITNINKIRIMKNYSRKLKTAIS